MKGSNLTRRALGSWVFAAMVAGCGGSQPAIGPPNAMQQSSAIETHAERSGSWMLREAHGKTMLVYVSLGLHRVGVFDCDTGKRVGTLTDFDDPNGGCVDAKGDVYITEYFNGDTVKYAHGGTKLLKTFASNGQHRSVSRTGRSCLFRAQARVLRRGPALSTSTGHCWGQRPRAEVTRLRIARARATPTDAERYSRCRCRRSAGMT